MTTHPSFMDYDRRDPLKALNFWERYEKGMAILCGLILLVAFLHFVVEPNIHLKKAEAAPIVDDKEICTSLGDYDIKGMEREVYEYCLKHMDYENRN